MAAEAALKLRDLKLQVISNIACFCCGKVGADSSSYGPLLFHTLASKFLSDSEAFGLQGLSNLALAFAKILFSCVFVFRHLAQALFLIYCQLEHLVAVCILDLRRRMGS